MFKYLLCLLIICGFIGCQTISPFAGSAVSGVSSWKNGEAKKYYEVSVESLHLAVEDSLKELNIPVSSRYKYSHQEGYRIIAGENSRFKIKVLHKDGRVSCVKIRINIIGDRDYAEIIYKTIDKNLLYKKFN